MCAFQRYVHFLSVAVLFAVLSLAGCQTAPPKGLNPAQIAVLKQQGFELTEEGWAFDLSGKVLFGSDLEVLNAKSRAIAESAAHSSESGWVPCSG